MARPYPEFYDSPFAPGWAAHGACSPDNRRMPAERSLLTHQDAHSEPERQIAQTFLVLSLGRAGRPFILLDDVPQVVDLRSRQKIAELDDLAVCASVPSSSSVSRKGRERIEAGLRYVQPDRFEVSASGAASTLAEIENQLIDA
jgi:hypothetical protein